MKIKNTIKFNGERTSISSTGNTEWYEFTMTSEKSLTKEAIKSICAIHGVGGQTFTYNEEKQDGYYTYNGNATCYCD